MAVSNNASPSPTPSSSSSFTLKTFQNPIPHKLEEDNFMAWQNLVLYTLRGQQLEDFLLESKVPKQYATDADESAGNESEAYKNWRLQDCNIISWLLASMGVAFQNRVVGCDSTHSIWARITEYFAFLTRAKVKQLKLSLKLIKKQGLQASEYLLRIKKAADSLAAVGSPLTLQEHTDIILDGLDEDYGSFIIAVLSRKEPFTISELEAQLMAQEEMLERFRRQDSPIVQANFTQMGSSEHRTNGRGGGGRFFRRGRTNWGSTQPQCQLCGNVGHMVYQCYHRYDPQF